MSDDRYDAAMKSGLAATGCPVGGSEDEQLFKALREGKSTQMKRMERLKARDQFGISRTLYLSEVDKARKIAADLPLDGEAALYILDTARELFLASFGKLNEPLAGTSVCSDVAGQPSGPGWESALCRPA